MTKTDLKNDKAFGIEKTLKDVELFALKYPQEKNNISKIIKTCLEAREIMIKENGKGSASAYKNEKEAEDMKNRLNEQRSHINKAINTLIMTAEELKDKETINRKEIKKLSKTLREAVGDIYYFIGVAPHAIEECYRMTAKYLKDTPPEKKDILNREEDTLKRKE